MTKRPKLFRVAVAAPLLWGALAMNACLLPQNDNPLPVLPTQFKNHRPQIIASGLTQWVHINPTQCQSPDEFQIRVSDEDVGDQLRSAWQGASIDGLVRTGYVFGDNDLGNQNSTTAERPVPLEPPATLFELMPLNTPGGSYTITVTVSDRPFSTNPDPKDVHYVKLTEDPFPLQLIDGGAVVASEPAGVDTFTWSVIEDSTCP